MQENKDYLLAVLLRSAGQRHVTTIERQGACAVASPKIEGVTPALGSIASCFCGILTKHRYGVSIEEGWRTSFGISSVLSQSVGGERPEIGNFSRSLGLWDVHFDRS